jgi:hypothetical protein
MPSFNAPRCQHIRTSGIQCGSPAQRNKNYCYYHQRWRPVDINLSQPGKRAVFTIPILEDAHSIQLSIAQVMHQLMDKTIDAKTAGLMLYALQIASANLRQLNAETPQPSQVVTDFDKLAENTVDLNPQAVPAKPETATKKSKKDEDDKPSEAHTQRMLDYLLYLGKHLDTPVGEDPEIERLKKLSEMSDEEVAALPPGTIRGCASDAKTARPPRRVN